MMIGLVLVVGHRAGWVVGGGEGFGVGRGGEGTGLGLGLVGGEGAGTEPGWVAG